ncbi:MAG: hypothetical protein H6738_15645 [Alphaproteobacteria bacterium]|nr:hypothetical protein [Alphaproteobacteria bacterium]MCB9698212.1 hypothetical protein [Alphaproteobacteria bacterium]
MLRTLVPALLLAVGCSGPSTEETDTSSVDTDTDTQVTGPTTTLIDTAWPPGDLGSLNIIHHVNTGNVGVFGVFAKSAPNYVNLAQCAVSGNTCVTGIPGDEDDWEDQDPDTDIQREDIHTRFMGYEITFGPYTMRYQEDRRNGFGYYASNVSREELPEGWIGASWGGQWSDYSSDADLDVSRPIDLVAPRPGSNTFITNGQFLPVEWVPTGKGIVTLTVGTRFDLYRVFHLEDDGYYDLDIDALGILDDTEELTLTLTRWDRSSVNFEGNVVEMVAASDVWFTVDYANIGPRERLYAADQCDEARGLPSVTPGGWWGRLDFMTDNLRPTTCLTSGSPLAKAWGKDALLRVEVPPKSVLNLDYNTLSESASLYVLTDCSTANSCVKGSDIDQNPNIHEFTNYFNSTEDPEELFIGLDTTGVDASNQPTPGDTVWTLDVTVETLRDPLMFDTCLDALGQPQTLSSGGYFEEFVAYTDNLNPGNGGCTHTSLNGADALMPFSLGPGQTFTVNVTSPGGDVGVYVLSNCNDVFSCVGGADAGTNQTEQLVLVNQGKATANLYLVVDSKGPGLRPFVMGVSIQ